MFNDCKASSVDHDQTARMRMLVWVYTGRKGQCTFPTPPFVEAGDAPVTYYRAVLLGTAALLVTV